MPALTSKQKEAQSLIDMMKELQSGYKDNLESEKQIAELQQIRSDRQQVINELQRNYDDLTKKQKDYLNDIIKQQNEEYATLRNLTKQQQAHNEQIRKEKALREGIVGLAKSLWTYLMQTDKVIRSTNLYLGMSGIKAEMIRSSFEQSALMVTRLGGNVDDIQKIMTGFADETGRARVLSAEMITSVESIARGTALGVEDATKLAAQFEFMGIDAKSAADYVQGVVETSERMGVNTTKVVKNINDNFKKLSTFTFQGGVKAYASMAESAEKTRVSMSTALDVAEATRSLDKVIDLGAQLQIMGGRFAEMDPFEWLYTVRNEPDKLNEKISKLTTGIYTLRKKSDGTFEKFISPADRDRLSNVAKSLGIAQEEMFQIAQRRLDMSIMDKQVAGLGLTKREKELIEGAAIMDTNTGRYQVMLAGHMHDVEGLTKEQASAFVQESASLKKRAETAQTFDEAFKITIQELKTTLIPMLQGVNKILVTIRPFIQGLTDTFNSITKSGFVMGLLKFGGMLLAGGFLLNKTWGLASSIFGGLKSLPGMLRGLIPKFGGGAAAAGGGTAAGAAGGGFKAGAGKGLSSLGAGAGIGVAMVGMGAGINLAATGISKLADSMSKLTPEQAKTLKSIAMTLAITFPLAAIGIAIVAAVAAPAAIPLLALGAAILGIGAGIGLATAGIGFMAGGLAKLITAGKDAGPSMFTLAGGIGAISLAMLGMTGGLVGVLTFSLLMNRIAKHAPALTEVGEAFKQIHAVMSGSKDDFIAVQNAVESISKMNVKGGGALSDLTNILTKPLKVEFADKRVAIVNDVTLNIDGHKFMQKTFNPQLAQIKFEEARVGQGSTKG